MNWIDDVQCNIARGLPALHTRYEFLSVKPGDGRAQLRSLIVAALPHVKTAGWQRDHIRSTADLAAPLVNLAFTRQGVELLTGVEYESDEVRRADRSPDLDPPLQPSDAFSRRRQPSEFGAPDPPLTDANNSLFRRLDLLGEADPSMAAPPPSWVWDHTTEIHALVWVSGADASSVVALAQQLRNTAGLKLADGVPAITGATTPDRIDSFGFVDGVSQPAIDGFHTPSEAMGRGAWTREGWRGLAAGEFVVGQLDEGGERREPGPVPVFRNSTYLVFRDIQMWPDRLDQLLLGHSSTTLRSTEQVASEVVGRRRPVGANQGTSLMVDGPLEDPDFTYGYDPEGLQCPLGAHIRRANPRDSMGKDGGRVNRHRLIRRGMPYEVQQFGRTRHGLAFIALQARIEDQFEFVQAHWLNRAPTLHAGHDPDVIAGVAAADAIDPRFVRQAQVPDAAPVPPLPLSAVRGGEYFVLPAHSGLDALLNWP